MKNLNLFYRFVFYIRKHNVHTSGMPYLRTTCGSSMVYLSRSDTQIPKFRSTNQTKCHPGIFSPKRISRKTRFRSRTLLLSKNPRMHLRCNGYHQLGDSCPLRTPRPSRGVGVLDPAGTRTGDNSLCRLIAGAKYR